jgi:anti-anti-sigma regulatory factor
LTLRPERAYPFDRVFTSQSLRAIVRPGAISIREHRLDDVVHQVEVRGTIDAETTPELARRIDGALAAGVRWLIADLSGATEVSDEALAALVNVARELRMRRGEMIVAGSPDDVAARLGAWEVAHRPALAANVDQAVMILKMLRPKTAVKRPVQRAKQRITSLTLPRVEPPGRTA